MNPSLLRKEVQEYLALHQQTRLDKFIFKGSPFPEITIQELAQQLDGKNRIKHKLTLWHQTDGILFPPKVNLEQTSSEATARYKASLVAGNSLLDLTGGFGVDCYYFSKNVKNVYYVEQNEDLYAFAKANFKVLKALNINCINGDSIEFLKGENNTFDTIYIDPSRRNKSMGKVFMLKDCLPNVIESLNILLDKSKEIWIKTAPILDITAGLKELKKVKEVHIISVKNEVKELLWKVNADTDNNLKIVVVDLDLSGKEYKAEICPNDTFESDNYSYPLTYLYEPSRALMKSGKFKWISSNFNLQKLHSHSHLYTNNELINFQGRVFKIEETIPYQGSIKKKLNHIKKANISTRNFPLSVDELRKKLKIKDGGHIYLFFTTLKDEGLAILKCVKA